MKRSLPFRLTRLAAIIIASSGSFYSYAQTENNSGSKVVEFDPIFLSPGSAQKVDISRFEHGATALPGIYKADVFVNNMNIGTESIQFKEQKDKSVQLCLSPVTLQRLSLDTEQLPAEVLAQMKTGDGENTPCLLVSQLLPWISSTYDSGAQRLDLSIPQARLQNHGRGYVSPELWDNGVPAALLGYNGSYYSMRSHSKTTDSAWLSLNAGLNLGEWQFRHNGNLTWQERVGKSYQRTNTYVQRDLTNLRGRIIMGENNTSGSLFDTLPFRGVELVDDERMLPQSERGYAPVIRGIARTNARITIRQNGQVIYESTVAPGAFNITDLYPTGAGGDLDVTVTEADGSIQNFKVPFASVNQLLRPGTHHYDFIAGQLNDTNLSSRPELYQLSWQQGLTNTFTGYGGVQFNSHYYATQLGTAINTLLGALAIDTTHARTQFDSNQADYTKDRSGQSYRVTYSKFVPETDSNFAIAAYRFSTSGYLDFYSAMQIQDALNNGRTPSSNYRAKNRLTATINQGLPAGFGQFYLTGYVQDYWNQQTKSDLQYQFGYNNVFHSVTYGINAGRIRNGSGDMETTYQINFSVPLGSAGNANTPQLTSAFTRDSSGNTGQQLGVSGSAGEDHQYSYGVTASHYDNGAGTSGSANAQYRSPITNITVSSGVGKNYQSSSAGLSGTIVGYKNGVVMTPYTSDTFAIIEADGAEGARVGGYSGVRVDRFGHAAVPYLNPYEMNEVSIDPKGLSNTVELDNTSQKVAPHAGSVVLVKYGTRTGYPILIHVTTDTQQPLPFGSDVMDSNGDNVGSVGQGGIIYARVTKPRDTLQVRWGEHANQSCHIPYRIMPGTDKSAKKAMTRFESTCQE